MKTVAILQSNYIPWKGYFDLIAASDVFVLYDDVQFTKNDWRNRNQIKTPQGVQWLTVPVGQDIRRQVRNVTIPDPSWQEKHWKTLQQYYRRAPHFDAIAAWLAPLYLDQKHTQLSVMNRQFIEAICDYLGITTPLRWSWEYETREGQTERLVDICQAEQARIYLSGPSAKDYLDTAQFDAANMQVQWADYSGYPAYSQLWGEFAHGVSILDLLFNVGKDAPKYMKLGRP